MKETKEDIWFRIRQELEQTTDGNRWPIDKGIFKVVLGLNALGFPTIMSCGGHHDERGVLYPSVMIARYIREDLMMAYETLRHLLPFRLYRALEKVGERLFRKHYQEVFRENEERFNQITDLLDAFLQDHPCSSYASTMYVCRVEGDTTIAWDLGFVIDEHIYEPEQRADTHLKETQVRMALFGDWLKKRFFEHEEGK